MSWISRIEKLFWVLVWTFFLADIHPLAEMKNPIELTLRCMGDPCIVTSNRGGNTYDFEKAVQRVASGAFTLVVIDGPCYSACSAAADAMRYNNRICITERAVMGFHQGWFPDSKRTFVPEYSTDIHSMVMRAGGFPEPAYMNYFEYEHIKKLWPTCVLNPPLPRSDPRKSITAAR